MTSERLEAFSDGVFAVAITLLVLGIGIPTNSHGHLLQALLDLWPSFAAYAVSFVVIGIIWVNHHAIFRQFARIDRTVMFLNLLLLLFVVLIPLGAGILARYIQSGSDSHIAAAFYSGIAFCMAIAFTLIWGYALRTPGILRHPLHGAAARASLVRFSLGLFVYLVTIVVAFISAVACLAVHGLVALYYVFDRTGVQLEEGP